jgi:hypothetical protein
LVLSDSPYDVSEFVYPPLLGVAAGLASSAIVCAVLYFGAGTAPPALLALGAFWGVLYGSSQQEIPTCYLYGVALFFGFFIWFVDNIGERLFVRNPGLGLLMKSPEAIGLHVLFTLCLASGVVLRRMLAPSHRKILPKD